MLPGRPEEPEPAFSSEDTRTGSGEGAPSMCWHHTLPPTATRYLSGGLSAGAAGGQERKGDNLGEGGVAAGLQLSAVGDCGLSHWTIGGRVWLALRMEV